LLFQGLLALQNSKNGTKVPKDNSSGWQEELYAVREMFKTTVWSKCWAQ